MNNAILKSPILWGFTILLFFSLWSINRGWASLGPSYPLQTEPPLDHYIYLPLIEKNYAAPAPLWRFGTAQVRVRTVSRRSPRHYTQA